MAELDISKKAATRGKVIGWLVTILCLWLVLRQINLQETARHISSVSFGTIVTLVCLYLFGFVVRGIRSFILLPQTGFQTSLLGVFAGYAANNILPARLGEFVRAHVVGQRSSVRRSTVFASIVIERILDGFAIVIFLMIGSAHLELPLWADNLRKAGIAIFVVGLLGVLGLSFFADKISSKLPQGRIFETIRGLLEGCKAASRSVPVLFGVVATSFLVWGIEGVMFAAALEPLGIQVPAMTALFVMGVINLGVLLPSSPGFVGVFQYFGVLAFSAVGVEANVATAYAVIVHICQLLPVTLIGLLTLGHFRGFKSKEALGEAQ
jgi:uncharacterized protein (TIRG00374 family)